MPHQLTPRHEYLETDIALKPLIISMNAADMLFQIELVFERFMTKYTPKRAMLMPLLLTRMPFVMCRPVTFVEK